MPARPPRYRVVLLQEPDNTLPVRYRPPRPSGYWIRRTDPLEALLEAFFRLDRRGEGNRAWAPVLSDNPLTFLLDAMGDAVLVRHRDGRLAYANPAARRLSGNALAPMEPLAELATQVVELEHRRYERRCMRFGRGGGTLILEVLRRLD